MGCSEVNNFVTCFNITADNIGHPAVSLICIMIKSLFTVLLTAIFSVQVYAQDATVKDFLVVAFKDLKPLETDGWKKNGAFIININQGALRNWAAGGEQNTLGIATLLNYNINHKKGRYTLNNYFDIALGFQNASSFGQFRKIDDRIDITSKYGYQFSRKWFLTLLANFNSQALVGYNYTDTTNTKISNFLTPGKILLSLGIDFRPDKSFSLFVSPLTTRLVIKNDPDFYNIYKFGVPPNEKSYIEMGAFSTAKFSKKIAPWALYSSRLDLFSNYKRNPQNVDLFFTNLISMRFNKWLGTNMSLDIAYDDDVMKKTQLKEILGLGLTLKL